MNKEEYGKKFMELLNDDSSIGIYTAAPQDGDYDRHIVKAMEATWLAAYKYLVKPEVKACQFCDPNPCSNSWCSYKEEE